MKSKTIKTLIILALFNTFKSYSQSDSLEYYSKVFKDTGRVCNGLGLKSFNYLIKYVKENETSEKWLVHYFGIDYKQKRKGIFNRITDYEYTVYCPCGRRDQKVNWGNCRQFRFEVKKKKIIHANWYSIR